jgi:acylphosphatase
MIRLTARISGRVQRVGYRTKVVSLAKELGLAGFIQNRPDCQTLVIAESEKRGDLERFASAIRIKNALIDVENIALEYSPGSGGRSSFRKITGPDEVGERLDDGIEILKELVVDLGSLTTITKDGFENLNGTMDRWLNKRDQMLEKQDESIEILKAAKDDTSAIRDGLCRSVSRVPASERERT